MSAATATWTPFSFPWDIIVIHGPCTDGIVAGWIVWSKLPADYRAALATMGGTYADVPARDVIASQATAPRASGPSPTSLRGAQALLALGFPIVFVETQPDEQLPLEMVAGRRVLFCDRGPGANVHDVVATAAAVRVIDHHSGSESRICDAALVATGKYSYVYEPGKQHSGASLTWQEFNAGLPIPAFVRCVQIADTWNWTQEPALRVDDVMTAIRVAGKLKTFALIDECAATFDREHAAYADAGAAANAFIDTEADSIARTAVLGWLVSGGVRHAILYTQTALHISKVGSRIRDLLAPPEADWSYERRSRDGNDAGDTSTRVVIDFTATWRYDPIKGEIYVSLRGNRPEIDLAAVSAGVAGVGARPGGGHRAAAGFTIVGIENLHSVIARE